MKTWITLGLVAFVIGVVAAQQDPAHPFPNHEEPPKGWYCTPDAVQPSHKCACKNMPTSKDDPICESETQDDPQCKVYCHKDHCLCQIKCEES